MSIIDWVKRRSGTHGAGNPSSPPPGPAAGPLARGAPPGGPGELSLDGRVVRFGRGVCRGFEAVEGLKVRVEDIAPHALGGYRATAVTLLSPRDEYEALVRKRDEAHGVKRLFSSDQPAEAARTLGFATLILKAAPRPGRAGLVALADALNLEKAQVTLGPDGAMSLRRGRFEAQVFLSERPYPAEYLETSERPVGLDTSFGFLGLTAGATSTLRGARPGVMSTPDPWALDGDLRQLSRMIRALAPCASAIVLPRAGQRVVSVESFLRALGDLDDPGCRPVFAWVRCWMPREGLDAMSIGMEVMGLPDVRVAVAPPKDAWERARALAALEVACFRMSRDNRELREGELVSVTVEHSIGPRGLTASESEVELFRAHVRHDRLIELSRIDDAPALRTRWSAACQGRGPQLSAATYRALFDLFAPVGLGGVVVGGFTADVGFPLGVRLIERRDGGLVYVTNGLGRQLQRGEQRDGAPQRIELMAQASAESPTVLRLLTRFGRMLHQGPGAAWRVNDTLRLAEPVDGLEGLILGDGGSVAFGAGTPVTLLEVVPLLDDEYAGARDEPESFWSRVRADPELAKSLRARWPGATAEERVSAGVAAGP